MAARFTRWGCVLLGFAGLLTVLPACAQENLREIEARAEERKAHGDAAGALAEWRKAARLDPQSARIEDEIGFLLAAGVLFALLYYVYRRPHERAEDVPEPGSGEELEARLALLDEQVCALLRTFPLAANFESF